MCQSVCYHAYKVLISEISLSDDDSFEPFFEKSNDNIESSVEADEDREINLQSLITIVDYSEILEIWKVSRYNYPKCYQHVILLSNGEHLCTCFMLITHRIICRHFFKIFTESSKAYFHLKLIPNRWYKDEYIDSDENYSNEIVASNSSYSDTPAVQEFIRKYTINDLSEKHYKQISKNKLKYGILMEEAKKAIQYALEDGDDELIQFVKKFNKRKEDQQAQAESTKQRNGRSSNEILPNCVQVLDLIKHQSKGRKPSKRLKSSTENFKDKPKISNISNSDNSRKCRLCGENGHYRNTCSVKI
ncbi:protein far1-related sequence 5-like [Gigaspora margarita]|uniref:Protein far1-related sequence 5-like n=1 Tax=Gigaspora margarita TaxID=4874 RepID=A0A8H4ABD7_GIGMA|nr:protein far1-related sequence 5-like [Gigaspora margarita]